MELNDLQDLHKGKMAFLVGAGPSLHFQNTELLRDHVTIAVNSGLVKVPFCDYFLSDDWDVSNWSYYSIDLPKLKCKCLLYKKKMESFVDHLDKDRVIWYDHKFWYDHRKREYNPDGLIFTKRASDPIIGARSSTGSAVHMAYIMGCDPIVLLGCDSCLTNNKRYYWQFPGERKPFRTDGRRIFTTVKKKINGKAVDKHGLDFIDYWEAVSKQAKKQNIHIIDVSGGVLECFEKQKYEDVFDLYGD
jgi:hypothetical protein